MSPILFNNTVVYSSPPCSESDLSFMASYSHVGNPEGDNNRLHRMDEAAMRDLIARSAFQLDGSGDLLRNPKDDHTGGVFAPDLRGNTDRFLFRLRKPE